MKPDLVAAIESFNKTCQPVITLLVTRDGRTVAKLPRSGQEIVVKGSLLNPTVKVTPHDLACLCEEARLAVAPGWALLEFGLAALKKSD